ncbi:MAG: hypothetical protein RMJ98_13095 [Myxococcales bacterium]|nr:hypothetical protein [Polyangiaceae bacterium]MDW8250224.1 hypothetical protein [Myxococcales bacterium]
MSEPLLLLDAVRVSPWESPGHEPLSLCIEGPRVLLIGDVEPVLGPLLRRAVIQEGVFRLQGQPLPEVSPSSVGLVPLDPSLPLQLAPLEVVTLGARVLGIPGKSATALAAKLCRVVGLGAWASRPLGSLHVAYRRLTLLALALVHEPSVLVLEAPLAGLEPQAADYVAQAILQVTAGKGALISSAPPAPESVEERLASCLDQRVTLQPPLPLP